MTSGFERPASRHYRFRGEVVRSDEASATPRRPDSSAGCQRRSRRTKNGARRLPNDATPAIRDRVAEGRFGSSKTSPPPLRRRRVLADILARHAPPPRTKLIRACAAGQRSTVAAGARQLGSAHDSMRQGIRRIPDTSTMTARAAHPAAAVVPRLLGVALPYGEPHHRTRDASFRSPEPRKDVAQTAAPVSTSPRRAPGTSSASSRRQSKNDSGP